ncbi:hypothetical protein ACFX1R_019771 [Malus domestica]
MLHEKGMPHYLWDEVVHTAVYLLNRCPTKALDNITPFEAYSKSKPGIAHLRIFGALCYVHVPKELRHKLESKSVKGVFVGYATCEKGYKVFDPATKKLILSRDIVFYEKAVWNWKGSSEQHEMLLIEGRFVYDSLSSENTLPQISHVSQYLGRNINAENSNSQTILSPSGESSSNISQDERNTQAFDHTPLKWRKLDEVLTQCNLCIMDLEKYEEAMQDES